MNLKKNQRHSECFYSCLYFKIPEPRQIPEAGKHFFKKYYFRGIMYIYSIAKRLRVMAVLAIFKTTKI